MAWQVSVSMGAAITGATDGAEEGGPVAYNVGHCLPRPGILSLTLTLAVPDALFGGRHAGPPPPRTADTSARPDSRGPRAPPPRTYSREGFCSLRSRTWPGHVQTPGSGNIGAFSARVAARGPITYPWYPARPRQPGHRSQRPAHPEGVQPRTVWASLPQREVPDLAPPPPPCANIARGPPWRAR